MSSSPSGGCIYPNPDIAGVGVRASIYAQNLLGVILTMLYAQDSQITPQEYKSIKSSSTNILLVACAILVSAIVQNATYGLSVYHAIIILNLSWINNTNLITATVFHYNLCYWCLWEQRETLRNEINGHDRRVLAMRLRNILQLGSLIPQIPQILQDSGEPVTQVEVAVEGLHKAAEQMQKVMEQVQKVME
jgi:hypothetical protein